MCSEERRRLFPVRDDLPEEDEIDGDAADKPGEDERVVDFLERREHAGRRAGRGQEHRRNGQRPRVLVFEVGLDSFYLKSLKK